MTSTQAEIEVSYDVSNEFFQLWLDKNMHYTSAVYGNEGMSLEEAQENKARILYDFAELGPDRRVLDIGCGWGAFLDYAVRRGVKEAVGFSLSTAQTDYAKARKLANARIHVQDYAEFEPDELFDGIVSIEMIDHLCSPAQARDGHAIDLYRAYFKRVAGWLKPGGHFGFQAILTNRIPRSRQDLLDLQFTADIIFPGGRNPRLEELIAAVNPAFEVMELHTRRTDYGRTTGEWLRRMRVHEVYIRKTWGDRLFEEYERYLDTCVRGFAAHWSSDVQMKLRRVG